jgi:uncharacterized low-complexity protein
MRFTLPFSLGAFSAVALATSALFGIASLSVVVLGQAPAAQPPSSPVSPTRPANPSPAATETKIGEQKPVPSKLGDRKAGEPKAGEPKVDEPKAGEPKAEQAGGDEPLATGKSNLGPAMPPPVGFAKLSRIHDVYVHAERKMVAVDGRVCLNRGPLEMFACPQKTKEHESIVAVNSDAMTVHAALLAIGAKSGNPVSFNPDYKPATGSRIDIQVLWTDKKTGQRQQVPAQQWIRHSRTKKQLEYNWVFGGSSFFLDEETKKQIYQAESGDLVCVSNFPTATLDLPVESSQANADLEFEAFTERIAPVGTPIRLIFSIGKP